MASPLDKLFAPFEGTREPYLVALFRVAFFTGLSLHFIPALLWLDENYTPGVLRTDEWNHWLYAHLGNFPHAALRAAAVVTIAGCVMGVVGLRPRWAALVCGSGFYVFASFNGAPVQTLAIVDAWAILLAWAICGGGSEVLSVDALLRTRAAATAPPQRVIPREPRLLPALVVYQVFLAVFCAGLEKVAAGWPGTNEMRIVLSYPRGFMVRDWVAASAWLHGVGVTRALSWFTVVVELGTPIAMLYRRTRPFALVLYEALFFGIIAMLEVPPLFYATFAFGALLVLDDAQVGAIGARLRAVTRRGAAA